MYLASPSPSNFFCFYRFETGNFTPNTTAGRLLVWCLGWLSIIAFGGIMIIAGYTYTTIADDLFTRFNVKWLQRPAYSAPLWALFSMTWIILIAYKARYFWDSRTPDFEYTTGDSYWFSYITVLTVGLGDFVLQPQGIFICDVFTWTTLLLHGFVFLSLFLGKVGELLQNCFPRRGESLEYHLARTDLCGKNFNTPVSKSLEILKEMVEEMEESTDPITTTTTDAFGDGESRQHRYRTSFVGNSKAFAPDGNTINYHRIRILVEKKNLLIKLLGDTQSELEDRVNESLLNRMQDANGNSINNNNSNNNGSVNDNSDGDYVDPLALHHMSRSLTFVEELQYEEQVLESTLMRTKEVRIHLEAYRSEIGNGNCNGNGN